jgi:hypothetical protein
MATLTSGTSRVRSSENMAARKSDVPDRRVVGCDRVEQAGDERIVISKREQTDWVASKHRPTAIDYEGTRYFVAEATPRGRGTAAPERGRGWRYRLVPWPDNRTDIPGNVVVYDRLSEPTSLQYGVFEWLVHRL